MLEHHSSIQSICDNCGTELEGQYCHHCGQRKINFKTDWKGLFHDVLTGFFHLEGKTAKGVLALAFFPGKLTRSFLDGKRVSQIPPLRSYLLVSILFFFALSQSGNFNDNVVDVSSGVEEGLQNDSKSQEIGDNVEIVQAIEALGDDGNAEDEDDPFSAWVREKAKHREAIMEKFILYLPKAFLLGVLFLALLLRIVMARTGYLYIEHLVTALNMQSFVFLWGTLLIGWEALIGLVSMPVAESINSILSLWFWICPVLTIRQAYRASILRTIVASMVIIVSYSIYLLGAAVGSLFLSMYLS